MAQCVQLIQEQDGSLKLVPDSQKDLSMCSYVLQSGEEVGNSLASLTPAQGAEISAYVAGLWALAWGIRQVAKVINESESQND